MCTLTLALLSMARVQTRALMPFADSHIPSLEPKAKRRTVTDERVAGAGGVPTGRMLWPTATG